MSMTIEEMIKKQQEYFAAGKTYELAQRIQALNRLEQGILNCEQELYAALKKDLGKSRAESYMCEVGLTLSELRFVKKHVQKWSREKRVPTPLAQFHARSFTVQEPYGVVLVMSPWNYPVLLTLEPLIGALAAGNCCVLKPSAYSPATSAVMKKMIADVFPEEYVTVIEGGREENQNLLSQKFDYIFFTGGVQVGKMVMEKAAANLTPVTLELGEKARFWKISELRTDLCGTGLCAGARSGEGGVLKAPEIGNPCHVRGRSSEESGLWKDDQPETF